MCGILSSETDVCIAYKPMIPRALCGSLQGTYLAASVQKDLDAMIEHKEPAAAGAHIRALHQALHGYWREVLGSSSGDLRVRTRARPRTWSCCSRECRLCAGA